MHRDLRSWLSVRPEYPNFQLNETFFKPFEHLICTEQCDSIVENQVITDEGVSITNASSSLLHRL